MNRAMLAAMATLVTVGTGLFAWLIIGTWGGLVLGGVVGLVGSGGGLLRCEWWRTHQRWYPGTHLYGPPPELAPRSASSPTQHGPMRPSRSTSDECVEPSVADRLEL